MSITRNNNNSTKPNRTPLFLIGIVCVMLSASFAAVPFYDWFCRVTGYGGTPEIIPTRLMVKF